MKNKARCRHLKKIFACCALVFLLFSISVPCFAVSSDIYTDNFPSRKPIVPTGGWTVENCESVTEIVEMAYRMNYFSGGVPVAILRDQFNHILVKVVIPTGRVIRTGPTGVQYYGPLFVSSSVPRYSVYGYFDSASTTIKAGSSATGAEYCMMDYVLGSDNNFIFNENSVAIRYWNNDNPYISGEAPCIFASGDKGVSVTLSNSIIGIRRGTSDWEYIGDNAYYCGYSNGYGDGVSSNISIIVSLYEERSMGGAVNEFNYELDIPSIITAIPNGAKQIINNVFGFELFGINVAGLLSLLLIISIVVFVVKKLIK